MNTDSELQSVPYEEIAEAGVLSVMLTNPSGYSRVSDRLEPEYFYLQAHQTIFSAIRELSAQGKSVTAVTVNSVLPADIGIGDMNGLAYLLHLTSPAQSASIINAVDYAEIIRDRWARRQIIKLTKDSADILKDPKAGQALPCINTISSELSDIHAALTTESIPMNMSMAVEAARRMMDGNTGEHEKGIPLPFPTVAKVLQDDLMPGQLYGLLGASGEGKTSLLLHIMRHAAEQGHPTALMSFDQHPKKCVNQLTSQALKIEEWRIRNAAIAPSQREAITTELARIEALPMSVILCPKLKIEGVLSKAQAFVDNWRQKTVKAPLIVIDHIRSVSPHDWRADAGSQAAFKNSAFKDWAKLNDAVAIMINQRNSQGMKLGEGQLPRPTAFDLHGGEAAKEDYDTILGMFRPKWWRDEALKRVPDIQTNRRKAISEMYGNSDGKLEVSLVKARHGNPLARGELRFEDDYTRVSEFETEQASFIDDRGF